MAKKDINTLAAELEQERARVDRERHALEGELLRLEEARRTRGGSPLGKVQGFTLEDIRDSSPTLEGERIWKIKKLLELPREIDRRFREAKRAYTLAIIPALEKVDREQAQALEGAVAALDEAKAAFSEAQREVERIGDEADRLLEPLGKYHNLTTNGPAVCKAEWVLDKLKGMEE